MSLGSQRSARRLGAFATILVTGALSLFGCAAVEPQPSFPDISTKEVVEEPQSTPIEEGTLDIYCNPPTSVLLDGKPIGTSPIKGYKVAPGSHDVTFADDVAGSRTMTVSIGPGEGRAITSDRAPTAANAMKLVEASK